MKIASFPICLRLLFLLAVVSLSDRSYAIAQSPSEQLVIGTFPDDVAEESVAASHADADAPVAVDETSPVDIKNAQKPGDLRFQRVFEASAEDNQNLRNALKTEVSLDLKHTPFLEALHQLQTNSGVHIVVDQNAIGMEAYEALTKVIVDLSVKQLQAGLVLKMICQSSGVGYLIKDGLIQVTSSQEALEYEYVRVYEIRDLGYETKEEINELNCLFANLSQGYVQNLKGCLVVKTTHEGHQEIESVVELLKQHVSNPVDDEKGLSVQTTEKEPIEFQTEEYVSYLDAPSEFENLCWYSPKMLETRKESKSFFLDDRFSTSAYFMRNKGH